MHAKRIFIVVAAAVVPLACSSSGTADHGSDDASSEGGSTRSDAGDGAAAREADREDSPGDAEHEDGDDALIVPEGLTVSPLPGGTGVLDMLALTVRKGPSHTEVYAALKNAGDVPACDAALSVELYDKNQQSLAAALGALLTNHLYRLTDGSGTIASCVGPGDVTMAAITDLPPDIELDQLGYIVYRCAYFALDVTPISGFGINRLESVMTDAGIAYAGTFVNGLDQTVSNPSVTVFSVNSVGRPLGATTGNGATDVPAGGTWDFQTDIIGTPGKGFVGFATAATLANDP